MASKIVKDIIREVEKIRVKYLPSEGLQGPSYEEEVWKLLVDLETYYKSKGEEHKATNTGWMRENVKMPYVWKHEEKNIRYRWYLVREGLRDDAYSDLPEEAFSRLKKGTPGAPELECLCYNSFLEAVLDLVES